MINKEDSIGFAIWLNRNRWFSFDEQSQKWCYTFEGGTAIGKKAYENTYMKTSDELFDKYLKDGNNFRGI